MADIEQAKLDFEANCLTVKGVVGVCARSDWGPCVDCRPEDDPHDTFYLSVYVDNVTVIDLLPEEFQGFYISYTVVPDGISPGCD